MILLLVLRLRTSVAHGAAVTCSNYKKGKKQTNKTEVSSLGQQPRDCDRTADVIPSFVHAGCCSGVGQIRRGQVLHSISLHAWMSYPTCVLWQYMLRECARYFLLLFLFCFEGRCVCVCVYACVRACMRVCACVHAWACVHACVIHWTEIRLGKQKRESMSESRIAIPFS